ncbi:hypothetical protein [Diaminobutyricimonas sp. LJ205]|uniref:hypothetical protein n=1 Tax=Diaminobutyricimonas sp. LJ205 TaxID=2683590 RepID=UPI0012F4E8BD|nr:hypothetical protein [Diaminobutyricimonas sp. LJ205]
MTDPTNQTRRNDEGIGLIEIVVSILLLGLLAVSALPLLVASMQTSHRTASLGTATQIVSGQLEQIRALPKPLACTAVAVLGGPGAIVTDNRGVEYGPSLTVSACPATYPGVVDVTAEVKAVASGEVLAEATTSVLVEQP